MQKATPSTSEVKRMWIDQPSALQPLHNLHGTKVSAVREDESAYRDYFLSGPVISQRVHSNALSNGWIKRSRLGGGDVTVEELVKRLRGVDHMSVEDCFLQSYLFSYAADKLEELAAENEQMDVVRAVFKEA